jgi:hypothetical protein
LSSEKSVRTTDRPFSLKGSTDEPYLSAMRMQIDYSVTPIRIARRRVGRDWMFYEAKREFREDDFKVLEDAFGHSFSVRRAFSLDAFAIRQKFIEIEESDVRWFLTHAGPFWLRSHPVTLRQFLEWQEFVKIILSEGFPDRALTENRAAEAMRVMGGSTESFFSTPLCPRPEGWGIDAAIAALRPGPLQERYEAHFKFEQEMGVLCGWFRRPPNQAFSIEWDPPNEDAEFWKKTAKYQIDFHSFPPELFAGDSGLVPRLRIAASNVLEAIAATIYVDRCKGVIYGECEFCGRPFKRKSGHNQKYCRREMPDGRVLESCKNAAIQQAWRDRKKEKELLVAEKRMNSKSKRKGKKR